MRFYVSPDSIFPEKNVIRLEDKKEIHHIKDVMRLRKGMGVNIFDGKGKEYLGTIKEISRISIIIEIDRISDSKVEMPYKVTLYQALPKKGRMDFIVEKAVELGAGVIVPMTTERTVTVLEDKKLATKIGRWERIVQQAAKQCGRVEVPTVSDIMDFDSALSDSKNKDLVIFAALDNSAKPLRKLLRTSGPKSIAIFVGPEGDFSKKEISMAKKNSYRVCSLGPLVLRVETAAIYILSCLSYEYNF